MSTVFPDADALLLVEPAADDVELLEQPAAASAAIAAAATAETSAGVRLLPFKVHVLSLTDSSPAGQAKCECGNPQRTTRYGVKGRPRTVPRLPKFPACRARLPECSCVSPRNFRRTALAAGAGIPGLAGRLAHSAGDQSTSR